MKRPMPNISAALAIAIERQVEDIIADAKAECARRYPAYPRPTLFSAASRPPETERRRELDAAAARAWTERKLVEASRPGSHLAESETSVVDPSAAPSHGGKRDFWVRLLSLFASRSPRA